MCLGLLHKKDYVRKLLEENDIAILNLQETEIPGDMNTRLLEIKNYTLEVEKSLSKRRVATYVHKDVKYKRRYDLESMNMHFMVIDVVCTKKFRIKIRG